MRRAWIGYAFLSPWLVGLLALTAFPILASLLLSFTRWNGFDLGQIEFVGLANWKRIGDDRLALAALANTAIYAIGAVPIGLLVALGLALLLNQRLPGMPVFRTLFYLPHVLGGVATTMLWMWMLNGDFGLVNAALRGLANMVGIAAEPPNWLRDSRFTKPALMMMSVWGTGASMLVFLAALQNVPDHLHEAARIDGAGRLRRFLDVTLPQITPALYFNLVMGLIGSFQVFETAFVLFSGTGGPGDAALLFVVHIYNKAFVDLELGYASALAWLLFVAVLLLTLLVVGGTRRWVYYEGDR